ncbi:hypothetical protein N9025_01670 [Synechococcus sp. AH-707-B22]|nr:hypothetical protein [Synechococcus sp. AH-707-B22]
MSFFTYKMDWKSRKGKTIIVLISLSVLLPLIGDLLSSRKYPSSAQAKTACYEWVNEGEIINYTEELGFEEYSEEKSSNRQCRSERETNQILGYEGDFTSKNYEKEGNIVYYTKAPKPINLKVVKHFRY